MNYTFDPKLRMIALGAIVLGILMFAGGYFLNASVSDASIVEQIEQNPEAFPHVKNPHPHEPYAENNHQAHIDHLVHQHHNRPWSAMLISAFLFTGIGVAAMFFLAIQHVAQAGWSVIVTRVMEAITAFIPIGGVIMLIIFIGSALHWNHLFHWMDETRVDFEHQNFDHFIKTKEPWLNIPFWLGRSIFYIVIWTFMAWMLQRKSAILDRTGAIKDYWSLYKWGVLGIIVFALTSMSSAWDWVMSMDPHWYSTLFGWYVMVSYLVSAVAVMILLAVHLKRQGVLPQFNDNHLHDLTKYLFGFSLLWGYLWLCQFELLWYANVPEEAQYFLARDEMYGPTYYKMLIINIVAPFLVLISSSIKRNYKVVTVMAVVVILGHWLDIFNQMMPATVGPWWYFGLLEFGSLLFIGGLFTFVVLTAMTKLKPVPEGNPLVHESKLYEYPF
ncbi:MAG: quinol:cytochrome C oxidoreductase [Weeksellaceae bacterium]|nr:quinol:cytochrome C oxidoreductase [Weeksellaceae bacterium]